MKDIDTLLKEVKRIHFIGIGGSGMCPLAEILLSLGYQLSGSDNNDTETFRRIEKEGAKVYLGQTKANLTPDIQLVIYTNAILKGNEELEWAKTHYPCFERAELLGAMSRIFSNCIGISGTHGKTTTTYLLKAILEQELGAKVGLIGTNQDLIGDEVVPTERTTPESLELQELFARMRSAGCTHVVMEASSHALALDRVYGIHYAVGIFTNLTQDHLDFHKTMEAYCDAKAILFQNCDVGVCNADDPWTERLLQNAACRQYFYAEHAAADLRAEHITLAADHIAFDAVTKDSRTPIKVGIPGGFMVYNTLDVLGAALALGVPLEKSARVLAAVPHVKGWKWSPHRERTTRS